MAPGISKLFLRSIEVDRIRGNDYTYEPTADRRMASSSRPLSRQSSLVTCPPVGKASPAQSACT